MYTRSTELFHAGTKGMKWGRRLYQNKDGSLTALGRVRYGKGKGKTKAELEKEKAKAAKKAAKAEEKSKAKAAKVEEAEKNKKKSVKEMTDQELKDKIARYKLEDEYIRYYASANPEKRSRWKELGQSIVEKAVGNIGEQTLTYVLGNSVNKIGSKIFEEPEIVNPYKGQGSDNRMKSAKKNNDNKKKDEDD